MKKIDLLHTTVLIVAILCGYSALQAFLAMLDITFYSSDIFYARSGLGPALLLVFIKIAIYTITCIILVRNSRRIATYLLGNERPEYDEFLESGEAAEDASSPAATDPDAIEWHLDRRNLIFVFFIGLGVYMLILDIPVLLNELIARFRDNVRTGALNLTIPAKKDYLVLDLLDVAAAAILIYAAPTLTNYIEKTISTRLQTGPQKT